MLTGLLGLLRQGQRDFDAAARAAIQSAKDAAGFEFLGTLVRTCLLSQSGGEDASDNGASVLLSNHSEFDNAVNKNRMLAGRGGADQAGADSLGETTRPTPTAPSLGRPAQP